MEQQKVDMFIGLNNEMFNPQDLMAIKQKMEQMDDSKFFLIQGIEFQKPSTIFLLALLLGIERFWLDDTGMGILKLLTVFGCGLWWLIDIFSAKARAKKYNFKRFTQVTMMA
jgi:TM2 domain-containing membrane protein YozV